MDAVHSGSLAAAPTLRGALGGAQQQPERLRPAAHLPVPQTRTMATDADFTTTITQLSACSCTGSTTIPRPQ